MNTFIRAWVMEGYTEVEKVKMQELFNNLSLVDPSFSELNNIVELIHAPDGMEIETIETEILPKFDEYLTQELSKYYAPTAQE